MNMQRTSCPRDARGSSGLTYTLVDHKWVCFADCCRVVGASRASRGGPGGPLNMHRSLGYITTSRPLARLYTCPAIWRSAYSFYNLRTASISRRSLVRPVARSRASGTSKPRCVTPRRVVHSAPLRAANMYVEHTIECSKCDSGIFVLCSIFYFYLAHQAIKSVFFFITFYTNVNFMFFRDISTTRRNYTLACDFILLHVDVTAFIYLFR